MGDKLNGEIVRIEFNGATFEKTVIEPTYINFFFGNNGTGKTTIAKAIKSARNVTYAGQQYPVLIYDQDFINDNMKSYHNMKGIFTFDVINVDIQTERDKITDLENEKTVAEKAKTVVKEKLAKLDKEGMQRQYKSLKSLREAFSKLIPSKFDTSHKLISEIRKYPYVAAPIEDIKRQYDAIFDTDAKEYEEFPTIEDTSIMDKVEDSEILGIVITNSEETEFSQFLARIGAKEWMHQAHEKYHDVAEGHCPYCYRVLTPEFEQMFIKSFDDTYNTNVKKLKNFLETYEVYRDNLITHLRALPKAIYPGVNEKDYREKLEVLVVAIYENIDAIKSKIAEPSKIVKLRNIKPILDEIMEITNNINNMIRINNEAYHSKKKMIPELRKALFSHMAYELQKDFANHDRSKKMLADDINEQQGIITSLTKRIDDLKKQLQNKQVKDNTLAMEKINRMLCDANFQGFELRPYEQHSYDNTKQINYQVVRTSTGKVAENLSEGEKNFIAFLYFYQKVFDGENKIVVIDDPVSSMDSNTMFIVGNLVRTMVEICFNNIREMPIKGNFIKQIFIMTHNAYFHRDVVYPHADKYNYVSFYLISKTDNTSSITLCTKQNPRQPSTKLNVNPVKNEYAALWEEYKEAQTVIPLMNTIRKILEYYFLQMCGHDGNRLRETILEENKDMFIENGGYNTASMMLSYIDTTLHGVNDSIYYVGHGTDVALYRKIFQNIFRCMGQEQHYNMMMGGEEE